ncbi:hypothetical protein AKJ16_DCAP01202 [Drosera capensis]
MRRFRNILLGKSSDGLVSVDPQICSMGPVLNQVHASCLTAIFTSEDVKAVLWSIEDYKAPGIDGYNAFFFKKSWNIIGHEVTSGILDFFNRHKMLKEINITFLCIVTKCPNDSKPSEFRPIACCTTLYKFISKMNCTRLETIMGYLVSSSQNAIKDSNCPDFRFYPKCPKVKLVSLKFADDLMILTKVNLAALIMIKSVLDEFAILSKLVTNASKSELFVSGVLRAINKKLSGFMAMDVGSFPIKYLGVHLSSSRLQIHQFQPLIEKLTARVNSWTSGFLSYAGRLQLVKAVLMSLKKALITWDTLCTPVKEGGSRVQRLEEMECRIVI